MTASLTLPPWRVWVDTGGTFTDCVALSPDGRVRRAKVLSSGGLRGVIRDRLDERSFAVEPHWEGPGGLVEGFRFTLLGDADATTHPVTVVGFDPRRGALTLDGVVGAVPASTGFELRSGEEAPVLAARLVTGTPAREPLPPMRLRLATTRGTNALLERSGAPVGFFVSRGFRDLLVIGAQQRPDLFALRIQRPPPLASTVFEVSGRLGNDGSILEPLDEAALRQQARAAFASGLRVAAVALLHAYRNPREEQRVEAILRSEGFEHVSLSSRLSGSIGLLDRANTAVANAYLSPLFDRYIANVAAAVSGNAAEPSALLVMTSAGGLVAPESFQPKDSLLSGPAAGVVGAAHAGKSAGFGRVIAFDMGGTSTDIARFDGDFDYVWRHGVAGVELLAPALAIESVAAGGGSICGFEAGGLSVGPQSAGAFPGPACYGAGGPLTITDCNLLLGRVDPDLFGIPLDQGAADRALEDLRDRIASETGAPRPSREPLLQGFIDIANECMADAIRGISLRKGYDTADYALVAFGGAGAQHCCGVARRLGITTIIVPPDPGLLSARGLGDARIERVAERQVLRPLQPDARWLLDLLQDLERQAIAAIAAMDIPPAEIRIRRRIIELRMKGQNTTIPVDFDDARTIGETFARRYASIYGHTPARKEIEVESVRVIAVGPAAGNVPAEAERSSDGSILGEHRVWIEGEWLAVPTLVRHQIRRDWNASGPYMVFDPHSVIVIEPGWRASLSEDGALILRAEAASRPGQSVELAPSVVREQLFTSRFEAIVDQMGEQLRRTALSVNVKERLDFSCALLDSSGELVANAPHIPVHLGAMGACVRSVAASIDLSPGDVVATNHPAFGGSHLPDITVVTPVHDGGGELLGYVANRAHHAEIGGAAPGSMPPDAIRLEEEGVVIEPMYLLREGAPRWEEIERLLRGGRYPSRAVDDNLADLRAQVAANVAGAALLRGLAETYGAAEVAGQMRALTGRSEGLARQALARMEGEDRSARERLDDGSVLAVRWSVSDGTARIDFGGTSPPHPGNLNATPAVVRSAVLYVMRLLIDEPIPLNEGLLRPVEIHLPTSLLNPPFLRAGEPDPAVVGGNTEVSQRLVDTLLHALGIAACSQGTMNNVLWGNPRFGYYETIAGGAGAVAGTEGCDAVHTHMTNTRITDAEVLEHRYPVRVRRFEVRRGSGGGGRWPGGDGVVREIEFLEPVAVSILAQHRVERPYGAEGGEPGLPGRQWLTRASGERVALAGIDGCEAAPGDRLTIETPGGGGWGIGVTPAAPSAPAVG